MTDCRRCQELISPYLDGELPRREAFRLTRHLSQCPVCRQELVRLEKLRNFITANRRDYPHVHPRFPNLVMEKIRGEKPLSHRRPARTRPPLLEFLSPFLRPAPLAAAAAGLLLIAGLSVSYWFHRFAEPETTRIAREIERNTPEAELANSLDLYLFQHHSHYRGTPPLPVQTATYDYFSSN